MQGVPRAGVVCQALSTLQQGFPMGRRTMCGALANLFCLACICANMQHAEKVGTAHIAPLPA